MYKPSQYNHYIRYNDKVLYFNALTSSSFTMTPQEHERTREQFADLVGFELGFPTVFSQFVDWGFIVEEGIDEFSIFKYRHYSKVFQSRDHHIVVNLAKKAFLHHEDAAIAPDLNVRIEKYIASLVDGKQAGALLLEFVADSDNAVTDNVLPVLVFAKNIYADKEVSFRTQMEIAEPDISADNIKALDANGLKKFRINLGVSGERRRENMKYIGDQAFFKRLAGQIEAICNNAREARIWLNIVFDDLVSEEETVKFAGDIPQHCRNAVILHLQQLNKNKNISDLDKAMEKAVGIGFRTKSTEDPWIIMPGMRPNDFTIVSDGEIYAGRYTEYDKSRLMGRLDENGQPVWDESKLGHYMGRSWFEHEKCARCNYLPIMASICLQNVSYYANKIFIKCRVADKSISPYSMIVRFFESKEMLQAMADAKASADKI